ncbi:hypothetical protein KY285_022987 [Solanum tuberosum]|nr:hypothetical protein KY285_022987 [Solanum tuberosum]
MTGVQIPLAQTTESSEVAAVNNTVDASHAFYIHLSDIPSMNLVSTVFDGRSYGGWRRAVIIALSAKNKLGFIDGSVEVPADTDLKMKKAWSRCNNMVLSWLLNSLSKEIAESILYSQSAKVLWSDLEDRFGQANGANLFQLQKDLNAVVQENSSISAYFTKMKSLWDELDALSTFSACSCNCTCGAKEKGFKAHQDERLLQFLMGLNDTFLGVRSNILLSAPLPTIGQAYSLREIYAAPAYPGDSTSFLVGNTREMRNNEYKSNQGNYAKKSSLVCNYCKKTGHTIDQCYKIHGFPDDFKFTKPKRYQKGPVVGNVFSTGEASQQGNSDHAALNSLSPENVSQLLGLLQKMNKKDQAESSANMISSDSGASEHITSDRSFFSNINPLTESIIVTLPNSHKARGPSVKSPQVLGKEQEGLYILKTSDPAVATNNPTSSKISLWVKGIQGHDLQTKKISVSRDVVFHEEYFPFSKHVSSTNYFPSNSLPNLSVPFPFTTNSPVNPCSDLTDNAITTNSPVNPCSYLTVSDHSCDPIEDMSPDPPISDSQNFSSDNSSIISTPSPIVETIL